MKPEDLLYASTHEWAHIEDVGGAKVATIGISAFAIKELNDIVFLALPQQGAEIAFNDEFGEVESVKAVSPLYSPLAGEVVEVNSALPDKLETLHEDPFGAGWMIKVKITDESSLASLLDYEAYEKQINEDA